jgi:hypothetical protein
VFLACVLGAYLLDVFWRERAAWLPVNVWLDLASNPRGVSYGMEMGSARSRPLRTDRQTNHASLDSYRTNRLPYYGRGCGVRLVVDSVPPVGGSV